MDAPPLFRALRRMNDTLSKDFLGGPKVLKASWVINLQKGGTLPFVLLLMVLWDNWSTAAWVYLALHGSYGLCWLLKDAVFPDPAWEERVTFGGAVNMWLFALGLYWVAPVLLITDVLGAARPGPPSWLLGVAILIYALGLALMMVADAQKYFTLRLRRGLITEGMFRFVRHPNYLGEMMLYGSFALLVQHWLPWVILAWVWGVVFSTNMVMKEASLSRHPGWEAYRARTGMLLPKPWAWGRRPTEPLGSEDG
jgi:protein-S-isoprenylcysteine O-methyltransferase Ste14